MKLYKHTNDFDIHFYSVGDICIEMNEGRIIYNISKGKFIYYKYKINLECLEHFQPIKVTPKFEC